MSPTTALPDALDTAESVLVFGDLHGDVLAFRTLAEQTVATEHVRLRGLMAVAPLGEDPAAAFGRLAAIREGFLREHPDAGILSAGMSGDLEQAISAGATHVRVGSAVLGSRPQVK